MKIGLPVRFTDDSEERQVFTTLHLDVGRTVLLRLDPFELGHDL